MSRLRRASALAWCTCWLLVFGCSLIVDKGDLERGCDSGMKACEVAPSESSCVSSADVAYGCARESCVPCTLSHAVEVCGADGSCAVGTCDPGYENCDSRPDNGCEVNLQTDYANCGTCGTSCEDAVRNMPRALSARCSSGRCQVATCVEDYGDCDGAASNGCETELAKEACGRCDGCPGATVCNLTTKRCE